MLVKKINLLKSFLVPLVFIASFAIVSNTLVSCKKNNSENSKTAKQNALEDLNKFMEIDVVLLYQKNTISEFTSEVLNETDEKGLMHDLISFLLTEFSIPLDSLLPISVFNDVSVFLKKFASINPNNQSWQQLANLIKQINSKAYSIQKLSSEKILSNLAASNSYTKEIIRHYDQKKIGEDFEFLEQGIGKRIKDSINILKPTIELIDNDTTLQALIHILSSDDFKNDNDLLEDTKSNQLFEFAINFGHFYYLLSANYISTWTLQEYYIKILTGKIEDIVNKFKIIGFSDVPTIFNASFSDHNNSASELLRIIYSIDDTCPWILEPDDNTENAKISSIPTFFKSESFTSKYYSIPTFKLEELAVSITNFLKEISIQWVKYTNIDFFRNMDATFVFLDMKNLVDLPIKNLICLPNKNNAVDEMIASYNKLFPHNEINYDATFSQVFPLSQIFLFDFSFPTLILSIELRGENINDWSNFFGSLSKFFCFNIISYLGVNSPDVSISNDIVNTISSSKIGINVEGKNFGWLLEWINQTSSPLVLYPSFISNYEENSIFDIIDMNKNSYFWMEFFSEMF